MSTNKLLLEQMGWRTQGQLHQCKCCRLGKCRNKHCARSLDDRSPDVSGDQTQVALEEKGRSGHHVYRRNVVRISPSLPLSFLATPQSDVQKSSQANHPTASQSSVYFVSNLSPNFQTPPTRRGIILLLLSGQRSKLTQASSARACLASAFSLCIYFPRFSGARILRISTTMRVIVVAEYPETPQSIDHAMSRAMAYLTKGGSCTPRVTLWTAVHCGSKMRRI